jgi:hypothetical protein
MSGQGWLGRLVRWLVIGPLALAGLAAVLGGVPVLLLTLGGNPLPERFPGLDRTVELLTRPDDGQLLVWALTVVGWVAWAVVAGSLLLELGAQLTGRRTPHLPGLGGPQRLANLLVAGVLAALTTPGISHAQAAYLDHPPGPVVAAVAAPEPAAEVPAAVQRVPRPERLVHEVGQGDWMWHIAGRYLGDELRYPEIAALNPGYAERYPDYPDHIQPGDRLALPADARDRGERRHATGDLTGTATGPAPEAGPPAPAAPPPPPAVPPPAVPSPVPSPTSSAVPAPSPPPQEAVGAPPPPPEARPGPGPGELASEDSPMLATAPLLAGGVLASVLVGGLLLYRRQKLAHRRYRRLVSHAGDAAAEAVLRGAATADVARLDRALRLLASRLGSGCGLPDIGAVWIGDGEIHLILATPSPLDPPPPFHASGPGGWFLPADASLPEGPGALAPLPALVTIGSQPGQHLLVDLERMGMLTITGGSERSSDLLRYLVAELAHNPWSDQVQVTLAGFPPEAGRALAALNPDRITVAGSLLEAATELRRRLAHTTGALAAHGLTDSVHGRVSDTAADTWAPHLLVVNRPRPEHDELLGHLEAELVDAGRRCAVAVATTAPAGVGYGRRSIAITDQGLLKAGFLDDSHRLLAAALPEHLLGPLANLIRDAAVPEQDHPIPPASEPWARGTDATGGTLRPGTNGGAGISDALGGDTPIQLPVIVPNRPALLPPALPPVAAPGRAATPPPAVTLTLAAAPALRDRRPDPELDQDRASWLRGDDQPPRIALLGPVQLFAPGPPPSHRARVCQELVVYLAAGGERGASGEEIARQLWPTHQVLPTVRTDVIMSVRRWLGTGADGEPWLSEATPDGRYRLRDGLLVDWHLFRRLRARGERCGLAGGADLRAALQLVHGPPLRDAGELAGASARVPYSWLPGSAFQPELILAGVVDTAHHLVDLSLSTGDLETARWAVRQAWLADTRRSDDHPWRDLLRIAQAEGDQARVREIVAELLRWRDAEHPDELAPATRRLIRSLLVDQPSGPGGRP